jgi:hypothetical protein
LIQQYLYIDRLLDSPVPHDMLNEYSSELEASAFRTVDVPRTITEEPATPLSPPSEDLPSYGACSAEHSSSATSISKKGKRTPKDIFRSPSETAPLLPGGDPEHGAVGSPRDGPKPEIPWLEDAELDSGDPIVTVAIWVNFAANTILLIGKIIVVAWVPSMSVLASLVDAVLDFLSTAIVFATTTLIASSERDQFRYPVGRRR